MFESHVALFPALVANLLLCGFEFYQPAISPITSKEKEVYSAVVVVTGYGH